MVQKETIILFIILSASLGAGWGNGARGVLASTRVVAEAQARGNGQPNKLTGIRLRSFIPGASGSLYSEPTKNGGKVRVTALELPDPQTLMPDGRTFVVWAFARGERPLRVGELRVDDRGAGGVEFARPAKFEQYSVVVTAEKDTNVDNPGGVMVLASRAGAITALYDTGTSSKEQSRRRASLERWFDRRSSLRSGVRDFYTEVEEALDASRGDVRTVELFGEDVAPDAYGIARVTARNTLAYMRALIRKLPPPSNFGAHLYVVWGVVPSSRIIYMGSLPVENLNDAEIYWRVGGFESNEFDLMVTAERMPPAALPSARRAIASQTLTEPSGQFGAIEGKVLDASGNPIANARVDTQPADNTGGGLPPVSYVAYTDTEGRFFLDGVPPGTHKVYADKEEEGYPSTLFTFLIANPETAPRVTVYDKQVTQGVDVRLGPKGTMLIGQIKDADTGRPIRDAEITLSHADNPNLSYTMGSNQPEGRFQRLIPSIPFRIKVSAPNYETWTYTNGNSSGPTDVLQPAPGATKEIIVSLRRSR